MVSRLAIEEEPVVEESRLALEPEERPSRLALEPEVREDFFDELLISDKRVSEWLPTEQAEAAKRILDTFDDPQNTEDRISSALLLSDMFDIDLPTVFSIQPEMMKEIFGDELVNISERFKKEPIEGGFFKKVAESWRRGDRRVLADIGVYEAAFEGYGNEEEALAVLSKIQLDETLHPIEGSFLADLVYSGAEVVPGMARGYWSAIPQAFTGMSAGALMALAAGQIPPLTLVPEEIVTVPVGTTLGLKIGLMTGAATFWYKQGAGSMYAAMIEKGYDPELSKYVAGVAAIPYAIVEFLQARQLTPGLRQGALKVTQGSILRVIGDAATRYGTTWTVEVFEEVVQEAIQIAAEDTAGLLSDELKIPHVGEFLSDRAQRVWQTTKEAGKAMALLPIPNAAIDIRTGAKSIISAEKKAEIIAKLPPQAPPVAPAVEKVGVKPEKGVITPPKPTEAKPEPPVKIGKPTVAPPKVQAVEEGEVATFQSLVEEAGKYKNAVDWEKLSKLKGHPLDNIPRGTPIIKVDSSLFKKETAAFKPTGDNIAYHDRPPTKLDTFWEKKIERGARPPVLVGFKNGQIRVMDGNYRLNAYFRNGIEEIPIILTIDAKSQLTPTPLERKPVVKEEIVVSKPTDIPKAPKAPVTEQKPTVELKGKEAQVFNEAVRTQEKITATEEGEVGIEPAGASFTEHLDTFHSYQLPATSKIPGIVHEMKVVNGQRLAGSITPAQANRKIYNLRKELMQTAIREKIALRLSKIGKVKIGLRKSGVFVPEKFATYTKFKDIEPLLGGGQDITRAIQQMDGSLRLKEKVGVEGQAGPIERYVLWRTRKMTLQKLNWLKEKTIELRSILSARKGSAKDKQINLILEQIGKADRNTPIKDVLSKETLASMSKESVKAAQELRQFYDDLIEEQNAARIMRSQDPIPYRQNYSPHILRDATIWEQLFRGDRVAKVIEKGDLPDYIKPNAPFNPRAQAREADIPYDKRVLSARELAESYVITAAKDIFNTSIIQNNKAFIDQLKSQGYEKSANYLGEWNATAYAGIKPGLDRHIKLPKWAQWGLRYFNRLRNMAVFPLNVAWSLSTQPLSLSNTVGRYGLLNTVQGFYQWLNPSIRKQAAQDYYSFIVKTTRRGGVTRQDAANLLGENIKTQKTVGEFVENYSTIVLTEMEKLLTGMSIRAAHLHGLKRGLKGEALKQYASDGGGKTQSMYNDEDKPMILRSLLVKAAAPYQTYAFEVANTFREWAGKTGTPPGTKLYAMWSATRWLATIIVLRLLANQVRGKKWRWWDLVPIPFREFWLSPIYQKLTGEFLLGSSGLPSPVETGVRIGKGINDVLETGSWRKLRNEMIKYGPGIFKIPGGVQWSRMVDAIITYSSGGLKDRRGRIMFEMKDPKDLARAMFTGVWSTKGGREYLEKIRGKKGKPVPKIVAD